MNVVQMIESDGCRYVIVHPYYPDLPDSPTDGPVSSPQFPCLARQRFILIIFVFRISYSCRPAGTFRNHPVFSLHRLFFFLKVLVRQPTTHLKFPTALHAFSASAKLSYFLSTILYFPRSTLFRIPGRRCCVASPPVLPSCSPTISAG